MNDITSPKPASPRPLDRMLIGSIAAVGAMILAGVALLLFSGDFASAQQAMYGAMAAMAEICRL
ncbi:MAG: hypothetical protein R3F54_17185 [Alphaproteobacteria bacterium]